MRRLMVLPRSASLRALSSSATGGSGGGSGGDDERRPPPPPPGYIDMTEHNAQPWPTDGPLEEMRGRANLQQYWKDFERRVSSRRPRASVAGKPTGRQGRRKTAEDFW